MATFDTDLIGVAIVLIPFVILLIACTLTCFFFCCSCCCCKKNKDNQPTAKKGRFWLPLLPVKGLAFLVAFLAIYASWTLQTTTTDFTSETVTVLDAVIARTDILDGGVLDVISQISMVKEDIKASLNDPAFDALLPSIVPLVGMPNFNQIQATVEAQAILLTKTEVISRITDSTSLDIALSDVRTQIQDGKTTIVEKKVTVDDYRDQVDTGASIGGYMLFSFFIFIAFLPFGLTKAPLFLALCFFLLLPGLLLPPMAVGMDRGCTYAKEEKAERAAVGTVLYACLNNSDLLVPADVDVNALRFDEIIVFPSFQPYIYNESLVLDQTRVQAVNTSLIILQGVRAQLDPVYASIERLRNNAICGEAIGVTVIEIEDTLCSLPRTFNMLGFSVLSWIFFILVMLIVLRVYESRPAGPAYKSVAKV